MRDILWLKIWFLAYISIFYQKLELTSVELVNFSDSFFGA